MAVPDETKVPRHQPCWKQPLTRELHTICLLWMYFTLGWVVSQFGPALPDLMLILNKDLDTASLVITVLSAGFMTGCFLGGILYDRVNKILLMCVCALGMACTTSSIPWCTTFWLMLVVVFMVGTFFGSLDTGGTAYVFHLWGTKARPFMQTLMFVYAVGGIASPFATAPFLLQEEHFRTDDSNKTDHFNNSCTTSSGPFDSVVNTTGSLGSSIVADESGSSGSTSLVHYAFFVTGGIALLSTLSYLSILLRDKGIKQENTCKDDELKSSRETMVSTLWYVILVVLVTLILFLYMVMEDTFSFYLMTFCLRHLEWTKTSGAAATSLFWAAIAVGRFMAIFASRGLKSAHLLRFNLVLLILSLCGLYVGCLTRTSFVVWLFVAMSGLSMSVLYPTVFTYTNENLFPVTGKLSGIFLLFGGVGLIFNPLLLGNLMDNISPIWFIYLLSCEGFILLCLHCAVELLSGQFPCKSFKRVSYKSKTDVYIITTKF